MIQHDRPHRQDKPADCTCDSPIHGWDSPTVNRYLRFTARIGHTPCQACRKQAYLREKGRRYAAELKSLKRWILPILLAWLHRPIVALIHAVLDERAKG